MIPALNEEESLGHVLEAVDTDLLCEILLLDGGSSDRTVDIAKANGARAIQETRRGYGRACAAGAAHAQGEIIIFMDADGVITLFQSSIPLLKMTGLKSRCSCRYTTNGMLSSV